MSDKVTFDGDNLLIIVNQGVTSLDVGDDVYSAWKRWVIASGAKYPQAFSVVGGDPLGGGRRAGVYIFLNNTKGWRLRPYEGDHNLTVTGNLYPLDPDTAFINSTLGNYTVSIRLETSSLATAVETAEGTDAIAKRVWSIPVSSTDTGAGTMAEYVTKKLLTFKRWFAGS